MLGFRSDTLEQVNVISNHAGRCRSVEKIGVVFKPAADAFRLFPKIERQIEMPKSYCVLPFQSREVLGPDGNSDSSYGETAVRWCKTSVSPRVRNQGANPPSVKLDVY